MNFFIFMRKRLTCFKMFMNTSQIYEDSFAKETILYCLSAETAIQLFSDHLPYNVQKASL